MDGLEQMVGEEVPHGGFAPAGAQWWLRSGRREGCQVLEAGGSVELDGAEALQEALIEALVPGEVLVADLSGAAFVDTSGLRALVVAQRVAMRQGARLWVVPSPMLASVIELGLLGSVLTVCSDIGQALAQAHSIRLASEPTI